MYRSLSYLIKRFFTFAFAFVFLSSCVDLDFDTPPTGGLDPNLSVNTTIAALKAMHSPDQYEQITDELILSGIVVSDDEAGNFFKQLVIQDETGGIEMRVDMNDMHTRYPVGRKVYIRARGLWLGDYNGLIQLGAGYDAVKDELIRIPESLVNDIIVPATYGNDVTPELLTPDQLEEADVSTLVTMQDVQFVTGDAGQTWAEPVLNQSLNRQIEDCPRRRLIVRSSGFADFAALPTPTGGGSITGILGIFGSDFQLVIRDLEDVDMNGPRCTVVVDEDFNSLSDNEDIILPEWANIAVKGARLWRAREFNSNIYGQATAFGDPAEEMESWLITPGILLNVPKKINFETAKAFHLHDGLSVWISNDFNGSDVNAATWTQLSVNLAGSSDPDHIFVPSGDIDLSGFSGTVRIGFKYVGSGPGGQTTTYRVDNVKVSNL